ncbi:hypothetical protein CSC66_09275 [Pseudoxanthomonas kaohsiungensis]|nr:hypothetical protein CSC66_09275 [Pseudoxanthomonas kaohsiungensis]
MVANLKELAPIALELVNVGASLAGLILVVGGLMKFVTHAKYGDQQVRIATPVMWLLSGIMLWNLGAAATTALQTVFGDATTTQNLLGYTPSASMTQEGAEMLDALVMVVRLVGYFFFVSGWFSMRNVGAVGQGGGNDAFRSGIYKIGAGACAINIVETVNLVSSFIGFGNVL